MRQCCLHGNAGHIGPNGEKHAGCSECFPASTRTLLHPHCSTCRCKERNPPPKYPVAFVPFNALTAKTCLGPQIEKEFWDRIKASIKKNPRRRWVSKYQMAILLGIPPSEVGSLAYSVPNIRSIFYRYDPAIGDGKDGLSGNKYDMKSVTGREVRKRIKHLHGTVLSKNFRQYLAGEPKTCYHNRIRMNCKECVPNPATYDEFRPYSPLFGWY